MDLQRVLQDRFGFPSLRPYQQAVIDRILNGKDVLAVMPTGSGKSLCYQLPSLVLPGITLVVSPLIALMKDQVDQLLGRGIPATVINSSIPRAEQLRRLDSVCSGDMRLLYVAPERFEDAAFRSRIVKAGVALLAVDEAHCVSLWGHDFRPDYLKLKRVIEQVGRPVVAALTATATPAVRRDILLQLGIEQAETLVGGFDRPNLFLEVREVAGGNAKGRAIVELAAQGGLGIVYCGTRRNVEDVAATLKRSGIPTIAYHAGLAAGDRRSVQEEFGRMTSGVVVATNAFGMGIDRPDVRFIVHADIPDSVEAYYQEIGRAGRDGLPAQCLLLFNYADKWIPELFIDGSHPPPEFIRDVFARLRRTGSPVIEAAVWRKMPGAHEPRFNAAIWILQRSGCIEQIQTGGARAIRIVRDDPELQSVSFTELERRREFEHRKLGVMLQYASRFKKHCFRAFILRYFGEWSKDRNCGNCSRCCSRDVPATVSRVSEERVRPPSDLVLTESGTTVALKIVSCVLRVKENLGRERVARILAGSKDASVAAYADLSTYGILKGQPSAKIVGWIDALRTEGLLDLAPGLRPTLLVTEKGRRFLKERYPLELPPTPPA